MTRILDRGRRGFTLAEILVVIIIIGVLMAIAIPALINALNSGRDMGPKQSLRNIVSDTQTLQVNTDGTFKTAAGQALNSSNISSTFNRSVAGVTVSAGAPTVSDTGIGYTITNSGTSSNMTLLAWQSATSTCWGIKYNSIPSGTTASLQYASATGITAASSCTVANVGTFSNTAW